MTGNALIWIWTCVLWGLGITLSVGLEFDQLFASHFTYFVHQYLHVPFPFEPSTFWWGAVCMTIVLCLYCSVGSYRSLSLSFIYFPRTITPSLTCYITTTPLTIKITEAVFCALNTPIKLIFFVRMFIILSDYNLLDHEVITTSDVDWVRIGSNIPLSHFLKSKPKRPF